MNRREAFQAIGAAIGLASVANRSFADNAFPSVAIDFHGFNGQLSDPEIERLKRKIIECYSGVSRYGVLVRLPPGVTLRKL